MIKLKSLIKEKKKPINELSGAFLVLSIGTLMKYLLKWKAKHPNKVKELKKFVKTKFFIEFIIACSFRCRLISFRIG